MVADALSRKSIHASTMMVKELELLEQFRDMRITVETSPGKLCVSMITVSNQLMEQIREK